MVSTTLPLHPGRLRISPRADGCKRMLGRDTCVVSSLAAQPLLRGSERFGGDARSIRRQLFADLDGSADRRQLDPVEREEASLDSLLHANELGIVPAYAMWPAGVGGRVWWGTDHMPSKQPWDESVARPGCVLRVAVKGLDQETVFENRPSHEQRGADRGGHERPIRVHHQREGQLGQQHA